MSPNKMYQKGYRKEREIMNRFRQAGCVSFRSAGSHSPVDVIGINPQTHIIELIQAKSDKMTPASKRKLEEANKLLNGTFEVSFKVI